MQGDPYREFIYLRTYSRFRDDLGRRETWEETVDRYVDFMRENLQDKLTEKEYAEVREAIYNQEVMPSMRLLWTAGEAARKNNMAGYNCSFVAPTKLQDFGEILYISTSGTGAGFSVEEAAVDQLPVIATQTGKKKPVHVVPDSKEGWADALVYGMEVWYSGEDVEFDYSEVRPAGARLKTMGGRASGPDPLRNLLDFTRARILSRQGDRLRTIDVHDIVCKIGDCVVSGGVRRSALIGLSDLDDSDLRHAKTGAFWENEPQRALANNSAVYRSKPTMSQFMREWTSLIESGTGERGIFNRGGLMAQIPERRVEAWQHMGNAQGDRLEDEALVGTNPCGEITLLSKQLCNLTEVVVRAEDTEETLKAKVRIATILGTYQSTLTNFKYVSKQWKKNCDAERLLGVSLTGQYDNKLLVDPIASPAVFQALREHAVEVNKKYAKKLGVNQSTCITCVKPSGTVSQLVNAASGAHPRFGQYYIKNVRISATDPLFKMLRDQGVPFSPETGQSPESAHTYVIPFPIAAPKGAVTVADVTAIDHLEHWKRLKMNFTEHNPSITISVEEDEWLDVGAWVWKNWEVVGGLSFLPKSDHIYKLAPYEPISKAQYDEAVKAFPKIDFSQLTSYETDDQTTGAKSLACVSGVCEIDYAPAPVA